MFSIAKQLFLMFGILLLSITIAGNVNAKLKTSEREHLTELKPLVLTVDWTKQFGTSDDDSAYSITNDIDGNVYVAGDTYGDLQAANRGSSDAFVSMYSSSGELLWTKQFGTPKDDSAYSIITNVNGNVYVAGKTNGSLQGSNKGKDDAFISKYSSSGELLWTRQFGTSGSDYINSVAINANGNIYVAGDTSGSLQGTNKGLNVDSFVRKYSSGGKVLWTRQFGTSEPDYAYRITADTKGNIYVAGRTNGSLQGVSQGSDDAFIRKYSSSGKVLWTRQFGTSDYDIAYGITTNYNGNVYVTGNSGGGLQGMNKGSGDVFIRKYSFNGKMLWTRQFGTSNYDIAYHITADAKGGVYTTGYTSGSLQGTNKGFRDAFISKHDFSGKILWTKQFGTLDNDMAYSMVTDADGNVYVAGDTWGGLQDASKGFRDAFIRKYAP